MMNRPILPPFLVTGLLLLGLLTTGLFFANSDRRAELYAAGRDNGANQQTTTPVISLTSFATGLTQPVAIASSGIAGDERLFVVQQPGQIQLVQANGTVLPTPFLDISGLVNTSGSNERGLLGLTFDPNYAENGYFYVNYTDLPNGSTQIARYSVDPINPNIADPNSVLPILNISQDSNNHNGGDLHFGPDGYLYIGMGDGGGSGDPLDRGQTMSTLLGKMLRIDVDPTASLSPDCGSGTTNYSIPADNPFVDETGSCNEIWAPGLRNPWRFSFDALTGDLYIADVGQNSWEEINWQPADSPGGENYGWRCYEGNAPYNTNGCGPADDYTFPVHTYSISGNPNCAITGGFVYRGSNYPVLAGYYLFADYCSGNFWAIHADGNGGWQLVTFGQLLSGFGPSSFGEDNNGELYVSHRGNGTMYRVEENSPPPTPTPTHTPTVTPTLDPSITPTITPTPSPTPILTPWAYLPYVESAVEE
jgi:glucose/arabinose dehydrogenase